MVHSLLAFIADNESNNEYALLVVPVDGSSAPTRVSPIPPNNGDAKALVWLNTTTIAFAGDVLTDGIDGLWIDDHGALHVETELGQLVDDAPYIYQIIDGQEVEVRGSFALADSDTATFNGTIGESEDRDFFNFTAAASMGWVSIPRSPRDRSVRSSRDLSGAPASPPDANS